MFEIDSQMEIGGSLQDFPQDVIKNEPMFFNVNLDFAWKNGGPITRDFINMVYESNKPIDNSVVVIDTRTHMLMPGWYPCIPGWHHDDVPRYGLANQPCYLFPEYRSKHVMALVNGDICPTQFAIGKINMPSVPVGEKYYKHWHPIIENSDLEKINAPSNKLIWFDDRTFHQGTRAIKSGWRWFGRLSYETGRTPTNEIRRQVQVYLENPMEGW